jgi:membrane protein DedA with SNARE-associated domain
MLMYQAFCCVDLSLVVNTLSYLLWAFVYVLSLTSFGSNLKNIFYKGLTLLLQIALIVWVME